MSQSTGMVVAATTIALACCTPPVTIFRSRADLANTPPIERLLVAANLDADGRVSRGFAGGLENRLAACDVASQVVISPIAEDPDSLGDTSAFHPSATLTVLSEGGNLVEMARDHDTRSGTLYFGLQLRDAVASKPSWVAKAQFHIATHNTWRDTLEGVRLATDIAARLRDDGVLPHCPPASVGWQPIRPFPGCAEERGRILAEAMQVSSGAERSHMIAAAPTCE